MKKRILVFFQIIYVLFANAQSKQAYTKYDDSEIILAEPQNGFTGLTGIALLESQTKPKRSFLQNYYGIDPKDKQAQVSGLLKLNPFADADSIATICSQLTEISKGIYTFKVRLADLAKLSSHPDVAYTSLSRKAEPQLNNARHDAGVDKVHFGQGLPMPYTGKGVLTGLVDVGIDYSHPAFKNDSGDSLRIIKAWAQNMTSGSLPSGFNYGRELSTIEEISTIGYDSINNHWHGTVVLGSMAAGGYGSNGKYKGAAPDSKIIAVTSSSQETSILDGASYFFAEVKKQQKRGVFNISWGSQVGPHDGTSLFDHAIDSMTMAGNVIVGAVGNWAKDTIHLKHISSNSSLVSSVLLIQGDTVNYSIVDIWGKINGSFQVQLQAIDKKTGAASYTSQRYSTAQQGQHEFAVPFGSDTAIFYVINTAKDLNNNRPNCFVAFMHNHIKTNKNISISISTGSNNEVHAWCAQNSTFSNKTELGTAMSNYVTGDNQSTIGEIGGTSKTIITVGAHVSHNPYKNWQSVTMSIPAPDSGYIADFSSLGPTLDGRTKPDITAPGALTIPVNSYSFGPNGSDSDLIMPGSPFVSNNRSYFWISDAATSYASPFVAGSVALLLQADPTLTQSKIRNVLLNNTTVDQFTGTIPTNGSNTYGFGKLNLYKAISSLSNLTGVETDRVANLVFWSSNPASNTITLFSRDIQSENVKLKVVDMVGNTVEQNSLPLLSQNGSFYVFDTSSLKNGQYIGILTNDGGGTLNKTFKLTKVD